MLAVQDDCVTPAADHELPVWQALGTVRRLGITFAAGSHCGFAAADPECQAGELACGTLPGGGAAQRQRVLQFLLPWLRAELAGDEAARAALQAELAAARDLACRGGDHLPARPATWGDLRGLYR